MLKTAMIGCQGHWSYVFNGIRNGAQVSLAAVSGGGNDMTRVKEAAEEIDEKAPSAEQEPQDDGLVFDMSETATAKAKKDRKKEKRAEKKEKSWVSEISFDDIDLLDSEEDE